MPAKKIDQSKEPWIDNYPPLKTWIYGHERACCMWQQRVKPEQRNARQDMVECWLVNGMPVLILVYGNGEGWNIFTCANTIDVAKTLADAEERTTRPPT